MVDEAPHKPQNLRQVVGAPTILPLENPAGEQGFSMAHAHSLHHPETTTSPLVKRSQNGVSSFPRLVQDPGDG